MTLPRHDINLPPGSPASDREGAYSAGHDAPLCAVCGAHLEEIDGERGVCPNCDAVPQAGEPPSTEWWLHPGAAGSIRLSLADPGQQFVGAAALLTLHRRGAYAEVWLTAADVTHLLKAVAAADVEIQRRRAAALRAVEDAKASEPAGEEPDLDF